MAEEVNEVLSLLRYSRLVGFNNVFYRFLENYAWQRDCVLGLNNKQETRCGLISTLKETFSRKKIWLYRN